MTQSRQGIDAEAALWAVRLGAGPLAPQDQSELDQWLDADTRHRGALLRARAAWQDLDRLAALGAHQIPAADPQTAAVAPEPVTNRRWFIAASVSALAIAGSGAWWMRHGRGDVYISDVGEVRRVALSDGSTMLLNTASHASVHFDEARREVRLDRGEGLFEVAKDPARPFVVRAGELTVRAVGTVFAVRAVDHRVDVTVTEGVVEVTDAQASIHRVSRVATNEHAVITPARDVQVRPIRSEQAERRLAWRDGMADFDGEALGDAIAEINRYSHRKIIVDDATLAARPVVGIFRASDAEGFAATVAAALDAERVDEADAIHLRSRPPR
jgi:transmembrane sensor